MKRSLCFLINPKSGVSQKNNLPKIIDANIDKTQFEIEFKFTEYKGHATELALEAVQNSVDVICAVGGDGSIHETAKSLIHSQSKLAIIPCGSGNGFARHLKIPLKIEKAVQKINVSKETVIDTGSLNGHPFINVCGFGFDALIAHKFDNYHKRGFSSYIRLVLSEFPKYSPENVSLFLSDDHIEYKVLMTTVANASQYGNGFKISPLSDLSDGKLELVIYKKSSIIKMLPDLFRFFNGSVQRSSNIKIHSFEEIELNLKSKIAQIDGEPLLLNTNIAKIKINPKSLTVLI